MKFYPRKNEINTICRSWETCFTENKTLIAELKKLKKNCLYKNWSFLFNLTMFPELIKKYLLYTLKICSILTTGKKKKHTAWLFWNCSWYQITHVFPWLLFLYSVNHCTFNKPQANSTTAVNLDKKCRMLQYLATTMLTTGTRLWDS